MKEELAYKEGMVTKVNFDKVNVEKEMETLKVRQLHAYLFGHLCNV